MKSARSAAWALGCALLLAGFTASAQLSTNNPALRTAAKAAPTPPAATVQSFDAFKSVPDRNIFNSRRYAGRQNEAPTPTRRDPVIESFSLLGTLDYPKGTVAFFEGSSTSHRKAATVDESIGGCKITGIEPNIVRLEANGKPVELKVGYMLRREDDGAWQMREAERQTDYSSSYTSSSSSSNSPFGSGGSSGFSRDSRSGNSNSSRDSRSGSSGSFSRDSRSTFNSSSSGGSSFGSGSASTAPGGSSSSPSTSPPSSGGGESDLLKRLMEQRSRENR